jgi:hypothetical protein
MPAHAHLPHGDLYIEYSVVMPSSVSDSTRDGKQTWIEMMCYTMLN